MIFDMAVVFQILARIILDVILRWMGPVTLGMERSLT